MAWGFGLGLAFPFLTNNTNEDKSMKQTMTLARAMKEKARIIAKITEAERLVGAYNAIDRDTRRPVEIDECLSRIERLESNLIALKSALAGANARIAAQLNEMIALRGRIAFMTGLDTAEFRSAEERYSGERKQIPRDVAVTEAAKIAKVSELQDRIDALQDIVDDYNATHSITVELA